MSSVLHALKQSLYEYEVLTAQQLGVIHSYRSYKNTIYSLVSGLNKKNEIRKIDVPALGRGSKAYALTKLAAKKVAESRQQEHLFKEKDWETVPGSFLNILMANQFFTGLIRATRDIPGAGLLDWVGRKSLAHKYPIEEQENTTHHLYMYGYAALHYKNMVRHIHVDVFTGNETTNVMEDKLRQHIQSIKLFWEDNAPNVSLLLLHLNNRTGERLLKISDILTDSDDTAPFIAVGHFEELLTNGLFSKVWDSVSYPSNEKLSLLEFPAKEAEAVNENEMIGKQRKIKFEFKKISGFQDEWEDNVQSDTQANPAIKESNYENEDHEIVEERGEVENEASSDKHVKIGEEAADFDLNWLGETP